MNTTPEPLTADPEIVRAWLTSHFGTAPGLIALCSTRNWTGIQTDNLDTAVQWAMTEDRAGVEGIYTRVTTVKERLAAGSRGAARDSHALLDMWSDLDFGDDGHKTAGLPKDEREAIDIAKFARLPSPSRVEHSGGGLYARWILSAPVVIGEDIDFDAAVQLAADWQNILAAGAKKMGVGYGTGVKDLARVLRLPGTINRKVGRMPVMARVVTETAGPRYPLDELLRLAAELKPAPPKRTPPPKSDRPQRAAASGRTHDGPGPLQILGDHACCGEILEFAGATYREQYPGSCSLPGCGGDCQRWLRPGWGEGNSVDGIAVHKGGFAATVRTDNFPGFDPGSLNHVLSPGQLFAAIHHRGDQSAAARDIRRAADGHPEATPAARALPAAALAEIKTARGVGRGQHLRSVPPVEGTAALDPAADPEPQPQPESGEDAPPDAAKPFDYAKVFGLPAKTKTPRGYRIKDTGVAILRPVGKEEVWVRFAFAPLVITATFEDPEGEQYIELSWIDRTMPFERKISRIVSRETAKRGRKLIEQLGGGGLPAVEGDARVLERWLAEFEAANADGKNIPSEKLARWLGWQDDGSFVSSPEDGTKVDVVYEEMRGPAKAHGRKGTLEGWKETVALLEPFPVPRIAIAAALAAPLLRPLGLPSFTLDISSRSTKGKTTSLQCSLSCWANPSEHANAMSNWRTTLYAIEKRLNLVRGIVTVFDETMAVTDEAIIDEVLYQLPMNHGKARSGGAFGTMLPWETILLSSGERPALSFTTAQGAAARILGTTIPPFGENGGRVAVQAREGVFENYGHAGPAFVEFIIPRLAAPGGRDALKQRHQDLAETFRGESDMTGRRAPMVAILALAEILACGMGLLPYEPLPAARWQAMFAAHSPTDNRPEMAMDVVREYVAAHSWELWTPQRDADDRPPFQGWLGVITEAEKGRKVALLPERVRKILADSGYSLDAVVGSWIDAGYLDVLPSQRPPHLIPKRFDGTRAKCLSFTPEGITFGYDRVGAA